MKEKRKHIWISKFQTNLLIRIAAYCLIYQLALSFIVFLLDVYRQMLEGGLSWRAVEFPNLMPSLIGFAVLIPILTWDGVRFAHRIVGPLYRFRKTIQALTNGETVKPIKLREKDMLKDLAADFNNMLQTLERSGVSVLEPGTSLEGTATNERVEQRITPAKSVV